MEHHADYVEQDLAVTRDGVLICLHDDTLERTSNVAEVYPRTGCSKESTGRAGRRGWIANDFTLAEIRRLDMGGWFDPTFAASGSSPGRRPSIWSAARRACIPS